MTALRRSLLVVTVTIAIAAVTSAATLAAGDAQRLAAAGTTLIVAAPNTPASLDPEFIAGAQAGWEIDNLVYDEKVYYKTDLAAGTRNFGAFEPRLFTSWKMAADKVTWTFKLRRGAKNHLGHEFTSADVVYGFQRAFGIKGLGYFLALNVNLTKGENVTAIDKYTVQVKLDKFSPMLLHQFTLVYHAMFDSVEVKKHATKDDPWATKWLGNNAAGFGAYYVDSYTAGQQLVLKANPNFYGPKPYFTTVIYKAVPDPSSRLALLKNGDVDIAEGLSPEQLEQAKATKGVAVTVKPSDDMIGILLQAKKAPLENKAFRQALMYATPFDQILKDIFKGYAIPVKSYLSPINVGYTEKFWPYTYDLAKAKELIAKSGVKTPVKLTFTYGPFDPTQEQIAVVLRTAWQQIGVNLTLSQVTPARFQQLSNARTFEVLLFPTLASHSADSVYAMQIFAGGAAACCDYGNYSNDEANALFAKALSEPNPAARAAQVQQLQRILADDPPWVLAGIKQWTIAHRSDVKGFIYNPQNSIWFSELSRG